jgi:Putative DNA-binding domain
VSRGPIRGFGSDLYSLGGILYVTATGARSPGEAGFLRASRPDLPSAFGDLTAELLSESPDDRPADAETVLERLKEIRYTSNIDAFTSSGESDKIEFKSSLHHPYGALSPELQKLQPGQARKEIQKLLRKSVTKAIAAFLNSDGGTLLIGVADSGTVLGIQPDFEHLQQRKQTADGWLLSLQEVIINALGTEVWNVVRVSLVLTDRRQSQSCLPLPARPRPGTAKTVGSVSTYERRTVRAS